MANSSILKDYEKLGISKEELKSLNEKLKIPEKKLTSNTIKKREKYVKEAIYKTGIKSEGFNLFVERMHNSIRERTKIFRGFHRSVESADSIMEGYSIFYNFIRKYQSINLPL